MKRKRIMIIGADSYIAGKMISAFRHKYDFVNITRNRQDLNNEVVVPDLGNIGEKDFSKVSVVINFAAIVHRPDIKDIETYMKVNFNLAVVNANKARRSGVGLFIQMSTIAVYGNAGIISSTTPCDPGTPYAVSKLMADEHILSLADRYFKVAVIRSPLVYGGGRAPGNMSRLISLANKGIPLPFKGAQKKRDFINVNNLIQYLSIIADERLEGIFLLSDHEPVSIEQIMNAISKVTGEKIKLFRIPAPVLKIVRSIMPGLTGKLYGSSRIETNFPHEYLINRHPFIEGIREMTV